MNKKIKKKKKKYIYIYTGRKKAVEKKHSFAHYMLLQY